MTLGPSGLAWTLSAKKTILLWGSQPFSSENPLRTLKTFCVPSDNNFPYPRIPNIIICIPLCYNLQTLELFTYPLGLKYPRLRNPALMGQLFPLLLLNLFTIFTKRSAQLGHQSETDEEMNLLIV